MDIKTCSFVHGHVHANCADIKPQHINSNKNQNLKIYRQARHSVLVFGLELLSKRRLVCLVFARKTAIQTTCLRQVVCRGAMAGTRMPGGGGGGREEDWGAGRGEGGGRGRLQLTSQRERPNDSALRRAAM